MDLMMDINQFTDALRIPVKLFIFTFFFPTTSISHSSKIHLVCPFYFESEENPFHSVKTTGEKFTPLEPYPYLYQLPFNVGIYVLYSIQDMYYIHYVCNIFCSMKWFVCLALLVVCAEALPRRVARLVYFMHHIHCYDSVLRPSKSMVSASLVK